MSFSELLPLSFVSVSWEESSKGVAGGSAWRVVRWEAAFLCPEAGKKGEENPFLPLGINTAPS